MQVEKMQPDIPPHRGAMSRWLGHLGPPALVLILGIVGTAFLRIRLEDSARAQAARLTAGDFDTKLDAEKSRVESLVDQLSDSLRMIASMRGVVNIDRHVAHLDADTRGLAEAVYHNLSRRCNFRDLYCPGCSRSRPDRSRNSEAADSDHNLRRQHCRPLGRGGTRNPFSSARSRDVRIPGDESAECLFPPARPRSNLPAGWGSTPASAARR